MGIVRIEATTLIKFLNICQRCLLNKWFELINFFVPASTLVKALTSSLLNYECKDWFSKMPGTKEYYYPVVKYGMRQLEI